MKNTIKKIKLYTNNREEMEEDKGWKYFFLSSTLATVRASICSLVCRLTQDGRNLLPDIEILIYHININKRFLFY